MVIIVYLIILMGTGYDLSRVKRQEARSSHIFESWAIVLLSGITLGYFASKTSILVYKRVYDIINNITGITGMPISFADTKFFGILVWVCLIGYSLAVIYLKYTEYKEAQKRDQIKQSKTIFIYLVMAYMSAREEPLKLEYAKKEEVLTDEGEN